MDYAVTVMGDGRPIGTEYSALNLEQVGCAAVKRESAQDSQRGPPAAKAESGPGGSCSRCAGEPRWSAYPRAGGLDKGRQGGRCSRRQTGGRVSL